MTRANAVALILLVVVAAIAAGALVLLARILN